MDNPYIALDTNKSAARLSLNGVQDRVDDKTPQAIKQSLAIGTGSSTIILDRQVMQIVLSDLLGQWNVPLSNHHVRAKTNQKVKDDVQDFIMLKADSAFFVDTLSWFLKEQAIQAHSRPWMNL